MKTLRSLLLMIPFFVIGMVNARSSTTGGAQQGPEVRVSPIKPITSQAQPVLQTHSYAQALNTIRTKMRSDQVWRNNQFTDEFINFVQNSASSDFFARALFQAGANLHVQFTGDNVIDRTILLDINSAIDRQVELLFPTGISKSTSPIRGTQSRETLMSQKKETAVGQMHLLPLNQLNTLGLCPLFAQQTVSTFTQVAPHYSFFNENSKKLSGEIRPAFENRDVSLNVPCSVQLGKYGNWNRTLIQCKTLDQFKLAQETGLSPAMCGGLSLNNGRLIRNYGLTGNEQALSALHNIQEAAQFLRKLKIGDWLNAEVLRENIVHLNQELGVDGINVSAVSTVSLFDSSLHQGPEFAVFSQEEFAYVQKVKTIIREGLKQDNYVHIMIIGNEEAVESLGHYFCFAIIKAGNEIQYVVLDTVPSAYHLQAGSHERDRLMFVIENIERGSSSINVTNLRIRFLR